MRAAVDRLGVRQAAVVTAAMLAVGLLAAACSSSSSSSTTTTTSGGGTTTTTSGGGKTTTTGAGGGSGANGSAFLNRFKTGQHATFSASYKVTSSGKTGITSFSLVQQPPNSKFVVAVSSGTVEFITTGGKSYYCIQHGGAWTCLNGGATASMAAAAFSFAQPGTYLPAIEAAAAAKGGHASNSTKTVNGVAVQCVSVNGAAGQTGTATYCVTAQGVLGYVQVTGIRTTTFEITNYSTSVGSGEFTLPAKPPSIP